jgi:DNA segregation ATPase FtsK/SpoIIIE, S-DNA-T family
MIGRPKVTPQPVRIVSDDAPGWLRLLRGLFIVLGWLLRAAWTLTRLVAAYPSVLIPGAVVAVVWLRWGALLGGIAAGAVVAVCTGMRLGAPAGFRRWVALPAWSCWRAVTTYGLVWPYRVHACGLSVREGEERRVPKVLAVASAGWLDRVHVRTLPGQHLGAYESAADALAHTFGASACRVRLPEPSRGGRVPARRVVLEFVTGRDPLRAVVPLLPAPSEVDLSAVAIGRTESGALWRVRVLGNHVLVVGVTGAGKGSIIWSVLGGLGPAIRSGLVQVWAVDPKGGMELGLGRELFARFAGQVENVSTGPMSAAGPVDAAEEWDAMAALLEDAVRQMRSRAARLVGVTRQHTPTPSEPLILVVVDEVAALTAYCTDRKLRARIEGALGLLLTQGRSVGVSVLGAVQDPRKEVLNVRNLFPTKIALRLDEADQVEMVLGDGARDRGAYADRIPEATPGVGYVKEDGRREPVRVRAAYHDDDAVRQLARDYAPTRGGLRTVQSDTAA